MATAKRSRRGVAAEDIEFITPSVPEIEDGLQAQIEEVEQRLGAMRETAEQEVAEAERSLSEAKDRLARIDEFLGHKHSASASHPVATGNAPKQARGHWQTLVGGVLNTHSEGLRKRELIEALGIRGDAKQQANLSSAIQLMKKSGHLRQDDDGRYHMT